MWRTLVRDILFWRRRDAVLWPAIVVAVLFCVAPSWSVLGKLRAVTALIPVLVVIIVAVASSSRGRLHKPLAKIASRVHMRSDDAATEAQAQSHAQSQTQSQSQSQSQAKSKNEEESLLAYFLANANWPMVIYLVLNHALALAGIAYLGQCKWQTIALATVLWPVTALGITAGVHRLWAHRSYSAAWPTRFLLMLINSMANQGTIFHWARDHRVHHRHSETEADPHNAHRGFFFAHIGWLLVKKDPKVYEAGAKVDLQVRSKYMHTRVNKCTGSPEKNHTEIWNFNTN